METRRCELCSAAAAFYCPSDSAFLCRRCDSSVHSANFLVARHLRTPLCCPGEGSDEGSNESSSLSSVCVSTTESSAAGRPGKASGEDCSGEVSSRKTRRRRAAISVDGRVEGILVNWCRRLGVDGESSDAVVATADRVFRRVTRAPVRVGLATSFWVGLRLCGVATCQNLVRVEKITGVPAKVILAVEGRVGRVLRTRGGMATECSDDCKEGWAEC